MSALRPETQRLIELARHGDRPAPGAQRRVERALAAKSLLVGGAAAGGAMVTTSAAASSVLLKPLVMIGVALGVATGGYGGVKLLGGTQPATPTAAKAQAQRKAGVAAAPPAVARVVGENERPADLVDAAEHALPAETSVVAAPRVAQMDQRVRLSGNAAAVDVASRADSASRSESSLGAETSGLRAAQKALRDGDSARALELLGAEAARHPQGALVQERAAAQVLALCQSGNVAAARDQAREFEARYPTSPLLGRVKTACAARRVAP